MVSKRTDNQEPVSYQALSDENHSLQKELNSLRTRLKEDERLRHAEKELRKSEERYRTLFMNMTEGFLLAEIIYNKDGKPYNYRYLEVNPAFELHTGMKREQLLGRTVLEVFPRVNHKLVEKYLEIAFADKSKHFEVFSQEFHKHLDIYAFSPGKGKIAIIFKDITERKQMQEKTRQRVEELEAVMEVAPVAISIAHDTQSHNITGNRMANEIYGAKTGENVSANITPVRRFFQKGHELAADKLPMQKATLKDIDVRNEELDVLLPSGEWVTILGSASPLHDSEGNVRGGVAAFMDITQRKKAEAKLKETLDNLEELVKQRTAELEKAYDSLKENEEHLRLALECAKAGMWMWDSRTNWKITPQINALFGRSNSSPVKYEEFTSMIHPEDQERVAQAWNKATECKDFYDQEYRIFWPDGSIHWLSSKGSVIELPSGIRQFMGITTDITERKQAEEKIRHLANIVESSNDAIITKSLDGTITSWNKGAEQVYGYSAEEILGRNITTLVPFPSDRETEALIEIIKKGEKVEHYETLRLRKDGIIINVSLSLSPVFDVTGKLTAISAIVKDITRRKKAEEALRKSKEQYQTLFNSISEGFVNCKAIYDEHGTLCDLLILDINPAGARLSGSEREAQIGKTMREIWPDVEEYWFEAYQKVDQTGKSIQFENFGNKQDKWFTIQIDRIEKGQFAVVFRDITERKIAEEHLRSSEERYRSFIQNSGGIAFQIDENFNLEFIHGAVKGITGYGEEELFSDISWRQLIVPEDLNIYLEAEKKAVQTSDGFQGELEYRIKTKDGKIKWVHEYHQKIPGKNGKPETYNGIIYDITEKKEAKEALARIEIARKKEIHHRIKNNLQVISSLLDLQAEKFRTKNHLESAEVLEAFRESQNRVMSIAFIHKELHEGGGLEKLNFSLYLEKLAENLFQTYRVGHSDISLDLDLEDNVFFDTDIAVPLGMIVNELISNSFKYAFPDRNKGTIRVKLFSEGIIDEPNNKEGLKRKDIKYTLIVSDNGIGIPENIDLENTDTLGLQLVSILVDQLDGKIKVAKDQGTEFNIFFNTYDNGD